MEINFLNGFNIKKTQIIAIILFAASVVFIWQILSIYPEIGIMKGKIKDQEAAVENSQKTLEKIKEIVSFTSKNKEVIGRFDSILPAREDNANLLSVLDSMARANGLIAATINFAEIKKNENAQKNDAEIALENNNLNVKNIKLSLRGSYSSFKNFLTSIEKTMRIMDIVSVNFSKGASAEGNVSAEKTYSFNLAFNAYSYNNPSEEVNIAKLLTSEKYSDFTVKNLDFIKEKTFNDLFLPPEYNVNIEENAVGNQNIF